MRGLCVIAGLLLISACETISYGPNTEIKHIGDVVVIYTDYETINKIYKSLPGEDKEVNAFRFGSTIYCRKWDLYNCGHELRHLTDDAWHK